MSYDYHTTIESININLKPYIIEEWMAELQMTKRKKELIGITIPRKNIEVKKITNKIFILLLI